MRSIQKIILSNAVRHGIMSLKTEYWDLQVSAHNAGEKGTE